MNIVDSYPTAEQVFYAFLFFGSIAVIIGAIVKALWDRLWRLIHNDRQPIMAPPPPQTLGFTLNRSDSAPSPESTQYSERLAKARATLSEEPAPLSVPRIEKIHASQHQESVRRVASRAHSPTS